jgi:hypothetical protein
MYEWERILHVKLSHQVSHALMLRMYTQLHIVFHKILYIPIKSEIFFLSKCFILWCIDTLLGRDLKTDKYSHCYSIGRYTAVSKQQLGKHFLTETISSLLLGNRP